MQVFDCEIMVNGSSAPTRCAMKLPQEVRPGDGPGLLHETVAMCRVHSAHPDGQHPHIATVLAIYASRAHTGPGNRITTHRVDAIAMEQYPCDLGRHLAEAPPEGLTLKAHFRRFEQLVATLCDAKRVNVSHGDLKEDNILVKADGRDIALTDFGSTCIAGETPALPRGARLFSPPEAFALLRAQLSQSGAGPYDCFAADVWAVGVMALRIFLPSIMATLRSLDASITADITANIAPRSVQLAAAALQTCAADPASPIHSPALAAVIARVFVEDPAQRATMEELRELFAHGAAEEAAARQIECSLHEGMYGAVPAGLRGEAPTGRDLRWWSHDVHTALALEQLLTMARDLVRALTELCAGRPVCSVALNVCNSAQQQSAHTRKVCSLVCGRNHLSWRVGCSRSHKSYGRHGRAAGAVDSGGTGQRCTGQRCTAPNALAPGLAPGCGWTRRQHGCRSVRAQHLHRPAAAAGSAHSHPHSPQRCLRRSRGPCHPCCRYRGRRRGSRIHPAAPPYPSRPRRSVWPRAAGAPRPGRGLHWHCCACVHDPHSRHRRVVRNGTMRVRG